MKVFGLTYFQYYYIVDSFDKSHWYQLYFRFPLYLDAFKSPTIIYVV